MEIQGNVINRNSSIFTNIPFHSKVRYLKILRIPTNVWIRWIRSQIQKTISINCFDAAKQSGFVIGIENHQSGDFHRYRYSKIIALDYENRNFIEFSYVFLCCSSFSAFTDRNIYYIPKIIAHCTCCVCVCVSVFKFKQIPYAIKRARISNKYARG